MAAIAPEIPQVEAAIIEMTNSYRAEQKLAAVSPSPALTAAARAYAAYLARTNSFAHDADGRQLSERVAETGYQFCEVSENLARSVDSRGFAARDLARTTVEGWINSPGHRRNIEAKGATEIGVAVARVPDKDPKYVAVQLFARPQALAFDVQIANTTKGILVYSLGGKRHDVEPHMAMTHKVCEPTSVSFEQVGAGARAVPLSARYEATSGQVFTVAPGQDGKPTVSVDARRRIR